MSKNLLELVNDVLKNVGFITGEAGEATSLTDAARQVEIDITKKAWNTAISELYSLSSIPYPQEVATMDITLVSGTREYALPSSYAQIRYPIIFEEDQHAVNEYPGGYEAMRKEQLNPDNYTGRPTRAVISPVTGKIRFDYIPTSEEDGDVYILYYDKELLLEAAADEVTFSDTVSSHMTEVVTEDWRRKQRKSFDKEHRTKHLSLAMKYLVQKQANNTWGVRNA